MPEGSVSGWFYDKLFFVDKVIDMKFKHLTEQVDIWKII